MQQIIEENEPYCYGLKDVPFFDTENCSICKMVERCENKKYKGVRLLK